MYFDRNIAEGFSIDDKTIESMSPVFKELNLSQENAQKLIDAYAPLLKQQMEQSSKKSIDTYNEIISEWGKETRAFLGDESAKKMAAASRTMKAFGTPELMKMLDETGVGNHKSLVEFFITVGEKIGEDSFVEGGKTAGHAGVEMGKLYTTKHN